MTQATNTLDDELAEIESIVNYGFADTEDGAIAVEMAEDAGGEIIMLLQAAKRHGYRLVLEDGDVGAPGEAVGNTHWRLEVNTVR